jgi:hypothetical protein
LLPRSYLDALIALAFAVAYAVLAAFLALLGTIHGAETFPYAVLGCLVVAEGGLWYWYFFLRRRDYRHKTWILLAGALALGIALTAAANASWGPLVDLEFAHQERLAAATEVIGMRDEELVSPQGNPIGVRLKYSVRFPSSNYFWQSASLQADNRLAVGVWADGHRAGEVIEPPLTSAENGAPRYEQSKTYDFTTEFLPNFLMWNPQKTSLCIVDSPPEYAAAFRALILNGSPLHYTVAISGTKYQAQTEHAYDLKSFYQSAEKEGATHLQGVGLGGAAGSCR